MKKYILLAYLFCFPLSAFADFDVMNVPVLTERVTDFSNILSIEQKQNLEQTSRNYENSTPDKEQIFVVLFPNRNGRELLDIGLKIFRDSGIGQKATNNGILLLIATEEKKIRIITGYWMEAKIPDILARDILEKSVRPKVNAGDFAGAIEGYFNRVMNKETTDSTQIPSSSPSSPIASWDNNNDASPLVLLPFILFALIPVLFVSIGILQLHKKLLKERLKREGLIVKNAPFSSNSQLLQTEDSTSWYRKKADPSHLSYESWDAIHKSLTEYFPVFTFWKSSLFISFLSIIISFPLGVICLFIPFFTFGGIIIYILIFYFFVSRNLKKSLETFRQSPEYEEYKNGSKSIYDVVWLSPPSRSSGGSWWWGWGGGWGGGGWGSSGGGGAGD